MIELRLTKGQSAHFSPLGIVKSNLSFIGENQSLMSSESLTRHRGRRIKDYEVGWPVLALALVVFTAVIGAPCWWEGNDDWTSLVGSELSSIEGEDELVWIEILDHSLLLLPVRRLEVVVDLPSEWQEEERQGESEPEDRE